MFDLCTVGDLSWLFTLSVPHIPVAGEVLPIPRGARQPGSDATIVSLIAARLGLHICLLAINTIAKGDGQPLLDLLQRTGVDISQINTTASTTPATFFLPCKDADERVALIEEYPFYPIQTHLPEARFAYIDVYEEHMLERLALIQRWTQTNTRCYINLSRSRLQEKAALLATDETIDTLQMGYDGNIEGARVLGLQMRERCHARAVVVTMGAQGAMLIDMHGEYFIPAEPIQTVRTVGAGASFSAGFLKSLMQNATYKEAALFASKQAAIFCSVEKNPLEVFTHE